MTTTALDRYLAEVADYATHTLHPGGMSVVDPNDDRMVVEAVNNRAAYLRGKAELLGRDFRADVRAAAEPL